MEGYLSKFSSGTLTSRWQKRYFVLKESGLEYYGKESHAKASIPGTAVIFPAKRIKGVTTGPSNRELELQIGRNKRKYFLKANSPELCSQWIKCIDDIVKTFSSSRASVPDSADSVASSEFASDMIASSSLNDNSSLGDRMSTGGPSVDVGETLWEQPEISPEEMDALFSEWFVFLEDPRGDVKSGRIIDAGSRSVSDLWAVLARLPRGEDVPFDEAKPKILDRLSKEPNMRLEPICGEYVMRLSGRIIFWLSRRPTSNYEDIPVVLEWVMRFKRNLLSLMSSQPSDDDGGSPTHSERGSVLAASTKWHKAINQLVRRLASEWEVTLIEQLNAAMSCEGVWDLPAVQSIGKLSRPHGPAQQIISALGAPKTPLMTTSWTMDYIEALSEKCLSRKTNRGTPWKVAYPTCAQVLTSHAASALVASLNSCWREVKRRSHRLAAYKSTAMGSMLKSVRRLTGRLSPSKETDTSVSPSRTTDKLNRDFANMLAFGNEVTVLSVFCQHVSADSAFASSTSAFAACMEGLSSNFAAIASEVSKSITKLHFLKANHKLIMGAFDPKHLAVRVKVPISETLEAAKNFFDSLPSKGCHDLLRYLLVGQVMQGVANAYITSLVRHRPKISKFSRLAAVVSEDEGLFFSMFRELGRPATEINSAIDQISHTRIVLAETNLAPPAKGGVPLVQECVDLTKAFPSAQRAVEVVKALLEIKGIGKTDRKDILYSVAECMQRNINSPSPAMLDLSREDDDDEEYHNGSGFSSNQSGKNGEDSS